MLNELELLTGESDVKVLSLLLLRAKNIVLAETNRKALTPELERIALEIALEMFNKQGSEGEASRTEGGIAITYRDGLPSHIKNTLSSYRLARCSGRAFEKEQTETLQET